ncbi:MAG: GntR family transcriptional regulator [Emcibacter sp.]|nr:GntR family transcriptional regulator [Emcibacter sp.]
MAMKDAQNGESIYRHIRETVLEQRLLPGTKLTEEALCSIYGAGRATIRKVLILLAEDHIVTLVRNKGAVVSSPSVDEARQVFEARFALETSLLDWAMDRVTKADLKILYDHIAREKQALSLGDIAMWIRLSGEFHMLLAAIARNEPFSVFLEKLIFRSSLIIGLYGRTGSVNCCVDDHTALIEALAAKDKEKGRKVLSQHLDHIRARLVFTAARENEDVYRALSPDMAFKRRVN